MRKGVGCVALLALAGMAMGQESATPTAAAEPKPFPERVLLIPIDDRPAATQFAQMIGDIAGVKVDVPPPHLLGRFTRPGRPDEILHWMRQTDIRQYDAVIVSTDMIAYGGLIASRTDRSSYNLARKRLDALVAIRQTAPQVPFYAFSAIMRIAPTATAETRPWRSQLAQFVTLREQIKTQPQPAMVDKMERLRAQIPPAAITRYDATRVRNRQIQRDLIQWVRAGTFTHLVLGQDDAAAAGPHVPDRNALNTIVSGLGLNSRVQFCAGIDQISNNLVSLVMLRAAQWSPRVRVVYSDPQGGRKIAAYEAESLADSLVDQVATSGAQLESRDSGYDYTLFLNTPEPEPRAFSAFIRDLQAELDQGFPVAVADTNLGWTGTADPNLFDAITDDQRSGRLLGYAGWNTAGNTMGTTIPAANAYMLARRRQSDALAREIAMRRFLLHRLVNDFYYHRYVRPEAYRLIEQLQNGVRDEVEPQNLEKVDAFVRDGLKEKLEKFFRDQMLARPFTVGNRRYLLTGLNNVRVSLPWPRAYEVFIEFDLVVRPSAGDTPPR